MDFTARLVGQVDHAMLLFQLRRIRADARVVMPPKGGSDVQLVGTVPEEKVDDLVKALPAPGAVHAGGRHFAIGRDGVEEHGSVREAEAHLGGPYTVEGVERSAWSFGGDLRDHLVQQLYFAEEKMTAAELKQDSDRAIDLVMGALKKLAAEGTVRKYRAEGGEAYALASDARQQIAIAVGDEEKPEPDEDPLAP